MYPKTETSTFDMDYYMKTHMPLVQEKWGSHGLKNWTVAKLDESGGYSVYVFPESCVLFLSPMCISRKKMAEYRMMFMW